MDERTKAEAARLMKKAARLAGKSALKSVLKKLVIACAVMLAVGLAWYFGRDFVMDQVKGKARDVAGNVGSKAADTIQHYTGQDVRQYPDKAVSAYEEAKGVGQEAKDLFGKARGAWDSVSGSAKDGTLPNAGEALASAGDIKRSFGALEGKSKRLFSAFVDALAAGDLDAASTLYSGMGGLGKGKAISTVRGFAACALAKAYLRNGKVDDVAELYTKMLPDARTQELLLARMQLGVLLVEAYSTGHLSSQGFKLAQFLPGPDMFEAPKVMDAANMDKALELYSGLGEVPPPEADAPFSLTGQWSEPLQAQAALSIIRAALNVSDSNHKTVSQSERPQNPALALEIFDKMPLKSSNSAAISYCSTAVVMIGQDAMARNDKKTVLRMDEAVKVLPDSDSLRPFEVRLQQWLETH